ncbi:FAD-linked oxidoreductase [Peniophora sp. CONT]|nr:FAD-linked oxidoreductase [Peniophora sp. CONT]
MLLRVVRRHASYRPLVSRTLSSQAVKPRHSFITTRRALAASSIAVVAYALFPSAVPRVHADAIVAKAPEDGSGQNTLGELFRQYAVYAMCSSPTLIDWAPTILETLTSIPIIKQITEAVVSQTFFLQFVGGPTTDECVPLLERLRKVNMGVLFAYSVEVDEEEASGHGDGHKPKEALHKRIVKEMMHSIDVAGNFEDAHAGALVAPNHRRAWVAVKLTALVPDHISLINFSRDLVESAQTRALSPPIPFPGCPRIGDLQALQRAAPQPGSHMTPADLAALTDLHEDLKLICAHAQKRGVRVIIDAEYSWYQPAVDALTLELMREFNRLPSSDEEARRLATPLVYNTFQAYLRRTPVYLAQSIKDARVGNYALGVKLVRGAYHEQENEAFGELRSTGASLSITPDPFPPVWTSKPETDTSYNTCARLLLDTIAEDVAASRNVSDNQWLLRILAPRRVKAPTIGVLFGSHNWDSIRDILRGLEAAGLAKRIGRFPPFVKPDGQVLPEDSIIELSDDVAERITIGQLYGMSNTLSNYIVTRMRSSTPVVLKYIPYGSLAEVMPYLARRAIENKAVLGNGAAAIERKQAWAEIRKRLLG